MTSGLLVMPGVLKPETCATLSRFIELNLDKGDVLGPYGTSIGVWRLPDAERAEFEQLATSLAPAGQRVETVRLSEMTGGHYQPLHRDNQKLDGTPNHTPQRMSAAVVYLTYVDGGTGGGEIEFPDLGALVRPSPGLAVLFPAEVSHQVNAVKRGTRHAITIWYTAAK